ncbi:MAG: hypothetical protein K2Q01_07115 [Rickettsiales bacterium]|nr:hypothetical protein [Rickettsiales bacterium]
MSSNSQFYSVTMGFMALVAVAVLGIKYKQSHPTPNLVSSKSQQVQQQPEPAEKGARAVAAPGSKAGNIPDPVAQMQTMTKSGRSAEPTPVTAAARTTESPRANTQIQQRRPQQQSATRSMRSPTSTRQTAYRQSQATRQNYNTKNR